VARQANLNETTIYRLLSGQGNPQLSSIMAMMRVMGLVIPHNFLNEINMTRENRP